MYLKEVTDAATSWIPGILFAGREAFQDIVASAKSGRQCHIKTQKIPESLMESLDRNLGGYEEWLDREMGGLPLNLHFCYPGSSSITENKQMVLHSSLSCCRLPPFISLIFQGGKQGTDSIRALVWVVSSQVSTPEPIDSGQGHTAMWHVLLHTLHDYMLGNKGMSRKSHEGFLFKLLIHI